MSASRIKILGLALGVSMAILPTQRSGIQAAYADDEVPGKKTDYKAAKLHYQNAEKAVGERDWGTAAKEFAVAYNITSDPVLFFKLGNAHQMNGDCIQAVIFFKKYIAEANPSEEYRKDTQARITTCQNKAESDHSTAEPDELRPDSGDADASPMDTLADDETEELEDEFFLDDQPAFIDEEITWQKTAAWTSVGVSAAFLTASAVLGLSAKSREEDLDNLLSFRDSNDRPTPFDQTVSSRYDSLASEGKTLNTMSMVALGFAGASAVTAVVFFLLDSPSSESEEGLTYLTPTIGSDSVGVGAGWTF